MAGRRISRCPFCETVVQVSDEVEEPIPGGEGTERVRRFLVHAPFASRCEGSGKRAPIWWLPGRGPDAVVPGVESGW